MLWIAFICGFSLTLGMCIGTAIACGEYNSLETVGFALLAALIWPLVLPSILLKLAKNRNSPQNWGLYGQPISTQCDPHFSSSYRR